MTHGKTSLLALALTSIAAASCGPGGDVMAQDSSTDTAAVTDTATPDVQAADVLVMDASEAGAADAANDSSPAEGGNVEAGADAAVENCPANPPVEMVPSGDFTASATWDCTKTYRLSGTVFVRSPAVLTIRPGTRITGLGMGAALVVTRGARLEARGTAAQPIVFTSANPEGMRRAGDWAGVVLLGAAPINTTGTGTAMGTNNIEGIEASDMRGNYGGTDAEHNCGAVRYVRIEYAGQGLSMGNELNGLTTGGCGRQTEIDFVQVHLAADDAFEFFGGTHDVRHLIASQADDDGLDWDFGWSGRGQFIVIQAPPMSGESDPRGIEADNNATNNDATPRSAPTLSNLTLVGAAGAEPYTQPAIVLRRGTAGNLFNVLVMDYKQGALDVIDNATAAQALATPPSLVFANSLFFRNGADGMTHATDLSSSAAEGTPAIDENAWLREARFGNRFDADPMLSGAQSYTAPDFAPAAGSPAATNGTATVVRPNESFFDATATYVGAVRPGESAANWTRGWTAYPAN